ncbi:MAG: radical SAM family heme chaperone HemW [Chloroflexota bacterium]
MNDKLAIFVFLPFCKIRCTYCDFNVYAHLARWMAPYADAVAREVRNSKFKIQNPYRVRSVYLGGGTPSLMPVASIAKILRECERFSSLIPRPEITLEANPGNVDEAKLRALGSLGVNRLSIGVQSFDDATLRRLNRGHTAADALTTYDLARRAGFENISLDLIYGLPLQTLADWRATLDRALALAPEHLSLYALKVEEGTGLAHQIARGKYPIPDDDLTAEMYELAEEVLDAAGYAQYEISNWAKRIRNSKFVIQNSVSPTSNLQPPTSNFQSPISNLQSRHNLTYWRNEPYLGFGAGAHSCFGGERFWNVLSPLEYIQRIARGESVVAGREQISRELEMAETMILGLRLNEGIAFVKFAERYGEDARVKYARQLRESQELGLLDLSDERARLTPRGRLLSNEVFWRLLPDK